MRAECWSALVRSGTFGISDTRASFPSTNAMVRQAETLLRTAREPAPHPSYRETRQFTLSL